MLSVSSRIWTRVAVSISYDDNDYTTGTDNRYIMYASLHVRLLNNRLYIIGNNDVKIGIPSWHSGYMYF